MSFLLQNKGQLTIEVTYSGLILLSALRFPNAKPQINPNNAIEIINAGLFFENTLLRFQPLAYGFETFAWRQKAELSRLLMVFKEQPVTDKCIFLG